MHITAGVFCPRGMGHLIKISVRMFAWYILIKQPLASTKMPHLSVPGGGQGHISRSNECIFENKIKKMFLFSSDIQKTRGNYNL